MMTDPENTFLASPEFAAAVEGARLGLENHGCTADDDTLKTIALSVLVKWVEAGGMADAAVLELTAMMLSVLRRMKPQFETEAQH